MSSRPLPVFPSHATLSRAKYLHGAAWGLFAISIWVGWILLTRYGVTTTLSPYDITALRFGTAGILLAPVVYNRGLGVGSVGLKRWLVIVIGAGLPYVLISSSGLLYAPAAHAGALIPGTMPLWATLLAMFFLKEKIAGVRKLGLMLIPVGILIFIGTGLTDFANGNWRGHLFFIAAAMCWASFTVAMRSAGQAGFTPLHAAATVSVVSAVIYLPVYVLFLPHRIMDAPIAVIVTQTIYQGIFVSIISAKVNTPRRSKRFNRCSRRRAM